MTENIISFAEILIGGIAGSAMSIVFTLGLNLVIDRISGQITNYHEAGQAYSRAINCAKKSSIIGLMGGALIVMFTK